MTSLTRSKNYVSTQIRNGVRGAYKGWCRFFFEADSSEQMRLFRLVFGLLLFFAYAIRAVDSNFYFGSNGVLAIDKMIENFPMEYRWSFLVWFPTQLALWIHTAVFLIALLTMAFGFFPRVSAAIAFLLHVSFMHRNMAIVYGLDMISVFFLFYLTVIDTRTKPSRTNDSWPALLSSSAFRMSQIQVCLIYVYSGWEKLKGVSWWRGEAIWTVFANSQTSRFQMDWVSHLPMVITALTYMTLIWEMYFPVFVWLRRWRPYVLVGGVLLHLGIAVAVFIPFFSALMIITYVMFLTPGEARAIWRVVTKYSCRSSKG